jgi:RNA polymerase sigma-70 factor (ECF subfamily)
VAISNETRRQIWQVFRRLPDRQREVFVLRHLEGWTGPEIATSLGLSPGSVKRHLFRAVHRLRAALGGTA